MTDNVALGRYGIWAASLAAKPIDEIGAYASEIERLGFGAAWVPGGAGGEVLDRAERLLGATDRIAIASGILNIWRHDPAEAALQHAALESASGGRFMMGIGISHAPSIDAGSPGTYRRPLAKTAEFLDGLDAAPAPVPTSQRMIAALAPKMVALARDRTAGSHTYNVPPEHTAWARSVLGPDAVLAPEQGVILSTDPDEARAIGRAWLARYTRMPNYANNWWRFGFSAEQDLDGTDVSDRLLDAVLAWGSVDQVLARVQAHLDAGADHVCIQVLTGAPDAPLDQWGLLAKGLGLGS
jgi:probable F420-dependent oxidoreductase